MVVCVAARLADLLVRALAMDSNIEVIGFAGRWVDRIARRRIEINAKDLLLVNGRFDSLHPILQDFYHHRTWACSWTSAIGIRS